MTKQHRPTFLVKIRHPFNIRSPLFFKWAIPGLFLFYFRSFQTQILQKKLRNRTWIFRLEGEHADHLTPTHGPIRLPLLLCLIRFENLISPRTLFIDFSHFVISCDRKKTIVGTFMLLSLEPILKVVMKVFIQFDEVCPEQMVNWYIRYKWYTKFKWWTGTWTLHNFQSLLPHVVGVRLRQGVKTLGDDCAVSFSAAKKFLVHVKLKWSRVYNRDHFGETTISVDIGWYARAARFWNKHTWLLVILSEINHETFYINQFKQIKIMKNVTAVSKFHFVVSKIWEKSCPCRKKREKCFPLKKLFSTFRLQQYFLRLSIPGVVCPSAIRRKMKSSPFSTKTNLWKSNYSKKKITVIGVLIFFNGPTPASFSFIFVFSNAQFLEQINVKKCIRWQDSNSRHLKHESPLITFRPGLPPSLES